MKKAERDVRNKNFKFNLDNTETCFRVLNRLESGVVLIDRDWKYRFLNDASLKLKSLTRDEVIGQIVWEVHPELLGTKFETLFKNAMATNEQAEIEEYLAPSWYHVKIYPSDEGLTIFYTDITSRKKAENHRELSDSIINSSSDVILTRDLNGNLTSWNDGAEKVFGYSRKEVLGNLMPELNPGYHREDEESIFKKLLKGESVENFETERKNKQGELIYLSMSVSPIKNANGEVTGISAIGRDITNQKRAAEELQKSNRLYAFLSAINQSIVHIKTENELLDKACQIAHEIGNYSMSWIALLNDDKKIIVANMHGSEVIKDRMSKIHNLDYSTPELAVTPTGRVLKTGNFAVSNNLQNDPCMAPWREEFESFGLHSMIVFPIKKQGKTIGIFGFFSSELNYFEDKEIKLLSEAATDISFGLEMIINENNRKQAELDLIQKEVVLNTSQEMARVGSIEIDLETNTRIWSDGQYRILGYEPNEVVPTQELYISHVHPEDVEEGLKRYEEAFKSKQNIKDEFRIITKDGQVKIISGYIKFKFDENGVAKKLYTTSQDVTQQVAIEQKLKYSEAFNKAVIDSLSSHICVLDKKGNIVATNKSWSEYGAVHKTTILPRLSVGENLFDKCEQDLKLYNEISKKAIFEMKEIFHGKKGFFEMEYPCQHEEEEDWFKLRIMRFDHKNEMIVVAHENITSLKLAEKERDNTFLELENRVLSRTKDLHDINTTFTDSINYAKRIQMGILTSPSQLKVIFHKSFLYARPCNILSGDFFWCFERNNLKYIVVADCTGHGVPGALMSIVGNTVLNRLIKENDLMEDPAEILYELDKRVIKALPGDEERKVMDGMDIAICVVNSTAKTVHFAGALRPLFILDTDGSIIEIQGNRCHIGRGIDMQSKTFETKLHRFKIGQTMYLTSDGYYSQFGGDKGKKLMKSAFKSILQKLNQVPIMNQKALIDQEFQNWKGDQQQVDDVLIVGIELD